MFDLGMSRSQVEDLLLVNEPAELGKPPRSKWSSTLSPRPFL